METSYKEEYYAYYNKVNFNQILAFIVLLSYVVLNFFGEGWGDTPVPKPFFPPLDYLKNEDDFENEGKLNDNDFSGPRLLIVKLVSFLDASASQ